MEVSAKSDNTAKELEEVKAMNMQILQQQQALTMNIGEKITKINENIAVYPSWDIVKQSNRYSNTDDIYSIVSLISTTSALIPLYCYEITNDKAFKSLKSTGHDPRSIIKSKILQTKALTELPETDKFYELMENPHMYLSKFEFLEALHTLLMMQGECIIYKIRNEFGDTLPMKLEFLESQNVVRHVSGFPHQITKYDYRENGILVMEGIPPEDIIHIRYFKGMSPLQALHRRLHRLDSEMDVSVAQMDNGGVPGVLYDENDDGNDDIDVIVTKPDGTKEAQKTTKANAHKINFYNYLQNKGNKGAPYMSGGKLGYIALGLKLADMDVAELSKIDFKKLCNAFRVSDRLFNNDAAGSEVSDDNARKGLYTNACLPDVYRVRDAFISDLLPEFVEFDNKRRTIKEDISEIPALQGDMLKMAQAYSALPMFIPNELREMFHLEKLDDPNADKMYVKTGYVALDDLQGAGDLPNTGGDYTAM